VAEADRLSKWKPTANRLTTLFTPTEPASSRLLPTEPAGFLGLLGRRPGQATPGGL